VLNTCSSCTAKSQAQRENLVAKLVWNWMGDFVLTVTGKCKGKGKVVPVVN
jgi:hypothetical protein